MPAQHTQAEVRRPVTRRLRHAARDAHRRDQVGAEAPASPRCRSPQGDDEDRSDRPSSGAPARSVRRLLRDPGTYRRRYEGELKAISGQSEDPGFVDAAYREAETLAIVEAGLQFERENGMDAAEVEKEAEDDDGMAKIVGAGIDRV